MELSSFLEKLAQTPESIDFKDTMGTVEANYNFTPAAFKNGETTNDAGQNSGSCKLFAFAKLNGLSETETLACFGDYYRIDVLKHPENTDHANIRNFIKYGWSGIAFESEALTKK